MHTGAKSFQKKLQSLGCKQVNALITYFLLHFSNKFILFWFTGIKFLLFPFLTHSIDKAKMSQKNNYDANTSCLLYKLVKQLPHYKGKYHQIFRGKKKQDIQKLYLETDSHRRSKSYKSKIPKYTKAVVRPLRFQISRLTFHRSLEAICRL